ncbi:hypothetical protein [Thalassotalea hakodatensis]|uniref:hypothetical protein n=1 Tax=Thalassotalea hakodatensis TaxID=3030492 RepID=UPI0025723425|nr:hypothetical protein [Thalassotalea hakodatensis]
MLNHSDLETIIKAAIFAPSADNSSPFTYEYHKNGVLSFYIDETRSGKATDEDYILSDISLGAVVENTVIQAEQLGYTAQVNILPSPENAPRHVADISFKQSHSATHNLADVIAKRCTDRRFPFKGPVKDEVLTRLAQAAEYHDAKVTFFTDKSAKKSALPVMRHAESLRFESKILHQELYSSVIFDDPKPQEGMPVSTLEIEPPARPFFQMMSNWKTISFFNKLGVSKILGFRSVQVPISFSPVLALISIADNTRASVIKGGQALQRFWLQAAMEELSVQPYAAAPIYSLRGLNIEPEFMPNIEQIKQDMKGISPDGHHGLMFLRLGYTAKPVKHRTLRRTITSYQRQT